MSTQANRSELWSPEARIDPMPVIAQLRQEAPVVRQFNPHQGAPVWLVTRYKESVEFLRDPRFIKDKEKLSPTARNLYFRVSEFAALDRHMLNQDPPAHTRLRALIGKAFTPRRVEALRPRIAALCHQLLDTLQPQGSMELISAFAFPLPITVIAEMLGVPREDHVRFREWVTIIFTPAVGGDFEPLRRAAKELHLYLTDFLARRRAEPGDDLTSALISAEEQGAHLTSEELLAMVFLLMVAGHETTVNLLSSGMRALLENPEQLQRLRSNPALIDPAVEELLRYCGPVKTTTPRFALEELEFAGQRIPAEEMIVSLLLSTGRDPEQFTDPDRLDLTRSPNRHIAFGFGMHFCVGAPLARLEASIAFPILLERLPKVRLAVPASELRWRNNLLMHGMEKLPLAF
ncbi:MAG TPA: cytochrome P450 [Myxococcaceae bacterium]